jgi:hypothetical protein
MGKDTMKAVVFKGPGKVVIEDRPVPKIQAETDIIVKVDKVNIQTFWKPGMKLTFCRQHYAEGTLHLILDHTMEHNFKNELHAVNSMFTAATNLPVPTSLWATSSPATSTKWAHPSRTSRSAITWCHLLPLHVVHASTVPMATHHVVRRYSCSVVDHSMAGRPSM